MGTLSPTWDAQFGEYELSENATVVKRILPTNNTWEVQAAAPLITSTAGEYTFHVDVLNDPSDCCWMIGVIKPDTVVKYAKERHDPHYKGMLVYRGDYGNVLNDGVRTKKLPKWGNGTGKTLIAKLIIAPSGKQKQKATLIVIGRKGKEMNLGSIACNGGLKFAMLTYRVDSRFKLSMCGFDLATEDLVRAGVQENIKCRQY